MDRVSQLAITLPYPVLVLPLIKLVFVQVESILIILIVLNLPYVYVLCPQLLRVRYKFYLLPFVAERPTSPKRQLIFMPVVYYKLLLAQLQTVFVVLNDKTWGGLVVHNLRYFFIVKLQKVRK
jgi:hypothetical protein